MYNNIKYLKLIEIQCNVLFLPVLGVELGVRNERKRAYRMWENAYLNIKNPMASRALKQAPDPLPHICSLHSHIVILGK